MHPVVTIPDFCCKATGQTCTVEVYADRDRHEVVVHVHPRGRQELAQPHKVANAFYREVLFRHLTPASRLSWSCVTPVRGRLEMQLEGLPGGYTGGKVEELAHVSVLQVSPASVVSRAL